MTEKKYKRIIMTIKKKTLFLITIFMLSSKTRAKIYGSVRVEPCVVTTGITMRLSGKKSTEKKFLYEVH